MNNLIYRAMQRQVKPLILIEKKKSGKWNNLAKAISDNNFKKKFLCKYL